MIPILFPANATQFNTNGIGRLADTISCAVKEERNGPFEMEMVYPLTGVHFNDIATSSIIVVKASPREGLQAFRVYKITKPINGRVKVCCRHISYQLNFIPVNPFSASTLAGALSGFKTNAMESCPFTLSADYTSQVSYAIALPGSIRSWLGGRQGSILDVYGGGEWEWNNYSCILHQHRGSNNGVVLRYGKNIVDVEQETNIENTVTGVVAYWASEDTKVVLPAPVEAPTAANFPFPRTTVVDFSEKFENAPTQAALQAAAEAYVGRAGFGIPKVSIKVTAVNLADVLEFKDSAVQEDIGLCDTLTVDFVRLGIQTTAKVVRTEYDVLKERFNSFEVGETRTSLADTIEDQLDAISIRPTLSEAQRSIDRATGVLNSGTRGHVIINRNAEGWANELLFLDNENIAQAVNVLRINNAGIGFSSGGYNGNYFQSWTLDGKMTLGGVNNAYGDLWILNESALPMVEVDKDGLKLWHIKAAGYYYNGAFYVDGEHTTLITPENGAFYFDYVTGTIYKYNGSVYVAVTDHEGIMAQMVHSGFGLYEGDIDLKWNGQTGIKFHASEQAGTSDELQIGDFMVASQDNNGRQILESSDEMTGMSGEPDTGQYFLWAGWRSASDFAFAVENQGGAGADNIVINGTLYVNGVDVMEYIRNIEVRDDEDDDGGGGDPEYTGMEIDFDGTPESNFDDLEEYYSGGGD